MQITKETNGPGLPLYPEVMKIRNVQVFMHDSGLACRHDYSCPCCRAHHAVLDLSTGIMQPCSTCASEGFVVARNLPKVSAVDLQDSLVPPYVSTFELLWRRAKLTFLGG